VNDMKSIFTAVFCVACVAGLVFVVRGAYYQLLAARHRRAEHTYSNAANSLTMLFQPGIYTSEGLKYRNKALKSIMIFLLCSFVALIAGWLSPDVRW
jgi:hypothetical protein